jgi:hypothetical protein
VNRAFRLQAAKELRALLPWWAGTIVAMLSCSALSGMVESPHDSYRILLAGILIHVAGAAALGALSIGHEYSHRTLSALLAQPVGRRQLLVIKFTVLAPMLAALGVTGLFALASDPVFLLGAGAAPGSGAPDEIAAEAARRASVFVPAILGLTLAPWLTMMGRGPMAGTVLSLGVPALAWALDQRWLFHAQFVPVAIAASALGAAMTWRGFLRLEAIDGAPGEITLPAFRTRPHQRITARRRQGSLRSLVAKEVRLQRLTFVLSAFYFALWLGIVVARQVVPDFVGPALAPITFLHTGLVLVMAGALASAEERHWSTADWQLLLPISTSKQWAVKVTVAVAIGLGLAVGLPTLLSMMHGGTDDLGFDGEALPALLLICVGALYVSSLSTSGMRALLASFPALAGAALIAVVIFDPISAIEPHVIRPIAQRITPFSGLDRSSVWFALIYVCLLPMLAGFVWLVLAFGRENHRSADRSLRKVGSQLGWIAAYAIGGILVLAFVNALLEAGMRPFPR